MALLDYMGPTSRIIYFMEAPVNLKEGVLLGMCSNAGSVKSRGLASCTLRMDCPNTLSSKFRRKVAVVSPTSSISSISLIKGNKGEREGGKC